jgi:hypothetical protein
LQVIVQQGIGLPFDQFLPTMSVLLAIASDSCVKSCISLQKTLQIRHIRLGAGQSTLGALAKNFQLIE